MYFGAFLQPRNHIWWHYFVCYNFTPRLHRIPQVFQAVQVCGNHAQLSPNSIMPTLQQSPEQVPDKVADSSLTQIMKVHDTNHVTDFHDLCPRQVPDFVVNLSRTLSLTFPVHCNGLNFIRATQTGLLQTCHRLCRKHLDILRWFLSATFVICVGNFHWNFMVSWFVTVCVRDFHDLCPRHSPRGSFGESQRNGIWALPSQPATVDCHVASIKLYC